ncbi:hypothetical protein HYH03_002244 [Edaphochlamys debaryana]|uniref:Uracil-DNA glycosylase-like domain-containing protein n=1 Tax=Edaphochlamys debaryana TaxID=47281 RepID=A0A836C5L0_9CHLO|nr:hypothetical protein HYH03_002244 [Edaphochlamys debaryana]|eukprot:KAG2499959.1 hypothetical protein HYH03_002244 [Edaphochlamys debaryana]
MSGNVFERFKLTSSSPVAAAKRRSAQALAPAGPTALTPSRAAPPAPAESPAAALGSSPAGGATGAAADSAAGSGRAAKRARVPSAGIADATASGSASSPPPSSTGARAPGPLESGPLAQPQTGPATPQAARRPRAASASNPAAPATSPATAAAAAAAAGAAPGVLEKLGDAPLRLVVVGHNPSAHAWASGHYYSNPSNHMWRILIATGIAPPGTRGAQDDDRLPGAAGVGFLDVGCGHPGTDSSQFSSADFERWSSAFYARLRAHVARAGASIGCTCPGGACGAPSLVAFSGKRQFLELLNVGRSGRGRVKSVEYGPQTLLPTGWPLPRSTEVWVCSSTSGAAALSREAREEPYRRVAERLGAVPWPRPAQLRCGGAAAAGAGPAGGEAGAAGGEVVGAAGEEVGGAAQGRGVERVQGGGLVRRAGGQGEGQVGGEAEPGVHSRQAGTPGEGEAG